ncbi:TRAP transporter small permease [Gracilinema caldarium]|uniref:Tripartite ATP-independent periplasmic transporter DctQ component n=1 Tax=Gracilinema caldarium (strain ATCC 51460 / DSM 7334 / H1) TaxID=744872 RepID=F8EZK3_GRAC1|nr:TRAP transporter small permease [Gracilinema caldarium]AEJ20727.1 Tripartite ATP-independent periplasmic transporter DctQ component [Gracilinema caldarium DSM 7334]
MLKKLIRFFNLIHVALVYIAQVLMIAMVLIIFTNVILRYVFNSGLMWSEELALLFAVWFIFIAMSIGVKQDLHINISVLPKKLVTPLLQVILQKIKNIIIFVIALTMLIDGWKLVQFTLTSIMPATKLPAGLLYAILPISSIIMIYESLMDLFNVDTNDARVDTMLSGKEPFINILKGGSNG